MLGSAGLYRSRVMVSVFVWVPRTASLPERNIAHRPTATMTMRTTAPAMMNGLRLDRDFDASIGFPVKGSKRYCGGSLGASGNSGLPVYGSNRGAASSGPPVPYSPLIVLEPEA